MYFYLDADRKPQGPYTKKELVALLLEGKITLATEVAAKGDAAWTPLGTVLSDEQEPEAKVGVGSHVPGDCPSCHKALAVEDMTGGKLPDCCPHCGRLLGSPYVGFWENALRPLKLYATISGRATRKEFWSFSLFSSLVQFTLFMVIFFKFASSFDLKLDVADAVISLSLLLLAPLLFVVPQISVLVRRLHDVGRSGWFAFCFIIVGILPPIFFMASAAAATSSLFPGFDLADAGVPAMLFFSFLLVMMHLVQVELNIAILVFCFMDSQRGPNKYGPSPKYPLG